MAGQGGATRMIRPSPVSLQNLKAISTTPLLQFPVAFGCLGIANAWQVATELYSISHSLSDLILLLSGSLWIILVLALMRMWVIVPDLARITLRDPTQSYFASLVPASGFLFVIALEARWPLVSKAIFLPCLLSQLAWSVSVQARLWQGKVPEISIIPALYLPSVAPNLLACTAAARLGWVCLAAMLFGAGLFSWLSLESMVLNRAATGAPLLINQRPVLGIQSAPAAVTGVAYSSFFNGAPDLISQALLGYAVYQALVIVRLLPWILERPFSRDYWSFTFGLAALSILAMQLTRHGAGHLIASISFLSFVVVNLLVIALVRQRLVGDKSSHILS